MKIWDCKFGYTLKHTIRTQWKAMISLFFALIGGAFTIAEILDSVFSNKIGYEIMRTYAVLGLIVILLMCVILNWKPLRYSCFIGFGDRKITLCVCDIFKPKGALIIPTNTTFDTIMEGDFISAKSVQGQYQEKYYNKSLNQLDHELELGLCEDSYVPVNDGRRTKTKRYPIGTVSKVSRGLQHDYFLAIADVNKHGKPENVSYQGITSALVSLWSRLNEIGHLENIRIPIIGTGKAGLPNASRDRIIQEIIFTYIVAAREMNVSENLIICICPSDFVSKNIHWQELCDYLRYTCKYFHQELGVTEGKAESNYGVAESKVAAK